MSGSTALQSALADEGAAMLSHRRLCSSVVMLAYGVVRTAQRERRGWRSTGYCTGSLIF
jgi:hypothetical protein